MRIKTIFTFLIISFYFPISYSQSGCGPVGTYYYYPAINQQNVQVKPDIWFLPSFNLGTMQDSCWADGTIILSGHINIHEKLSDSIVQKIDINDFYNYGAITYTDTLIFSLNDSLDYSTTYYVTKDSSTLSHCQCGEYWFDYKNHLTNQKHWFHWQPSFSEYLWEFTTEADPYLENSNNNIADIQLYPNPSNDKLIIEGIFKNFVIYDHYGKVVMVSNKRNIDISNLSKGIYFIEINQNGTFKMIRFLKQ